MVAARYDLSPEAQRIRRRLRSNGEPRGALTIEAAVKAAAAEGIELSREVWRELVIQEPGARVIPSWLVDFLVLYSESREPRRLLNLSSGDGTLALDLVERLPDVDITAVDPQSAGVDAARHFDPEGRVKWHVGRPLDFLASSDAPRQPIDLLVSLAPFGYGREPYEVQTADGLRLHGQDEAGRIELLRATPFLAADAEALLVTGEGFLFPGKTQKFREAMQAQGLWMRAALSLPAGSFAPMTSISAVLVVFSRTPQDHVFLAQMPKTRQGQQQLLTNMALGRAGKTPESGILLPIRELTPLHTVIARRQAERELRECATEIVLLGDITHSVNRPLERDGRLQFDDLENTVFMPLVGFGPARLELPEKLSREWVQIALDPPRASAAYVAQWLSSPLGRRIREAEATGVTIPRTRETALAGLRVPLPPVQEQERLLTLDTRLSSLGSEIQGLRANLWAKPGQLDEVSRRIRRIAPEDDISRWIESLPLPLATVGRAYYARSDVRQRLDALFNLFEAMAEFHATALLSGIASDQAYFTEARDNLLGSEAERQRYFKKATLGGWTTLAGRLAKDVRRRLSQGGDEGEYERGRVLEWFGRPQPGWIEMMAEASIYSTLEQARRRRNDWKGHGGASSERVVTERLDELETLLESLRSVIGDHWEDAHLVAPVSLSMSGGVFEATVDLLAGTGVPFRQKKVVVSDPLDNERLYIIHGDGPAAMQLLPLVRMMSSPSTADVACYFYSRVEGDDLRYVSFYYEGEPEAVVANSDAASTDVLQALGLG